MKTGTCTWRTVRSASILVLAMIHVPAHARPSGPAVVRAAKEAPAARHPNIIFILTDDQRYDELGFVNREIRTPVLDRMARDGVHLKNAFVTSSLCSPSRATILTGEYMHDHGIVDNNAGDESGQIYFPQYLQKAGYQTAFFGKWHMGALNDDPRPGFDRWVSFEGQGVYWPRLADGSTAQLNVDGRHVPQKGYITDELTNYALDWLKQRDAKKPFFLYLSHKALHADFQPATRHKELYRNTPIALPATYDETKSPDSDGKPRWVHNQRNSWHGVEFPYHSTLDLKEYKRRYHQTLAAVDESTGRLLDHLRKNGLLDNTVVMFMGDNGFMFGEHGLIDKRNAYEESMRVPLIAYGPGVIQRGKTVTDMVANLDIAPTILDLAGVARPAQFSGVSFVPQLEGQAPARPWRSSLLYEYYWEYNYPQTPTTFALRGDRYKLIQYHGVWDTEELYDIQADPQETRNLIASKDLQPVVTAMRRDLFGQLNARGGGHHVNFTERLGEGSTFRRRDGSTAAQFPQRWLRNGKEADLTDATKTEGGRRTQ
ncbi:sulfatase family protein [Sphingomonas sp. CFBP 13733]|uniref:sulfatase family protein n=1 Tax=Sphingomonas sp. CFBP 13733 TaxID=2775291 RepID=UPI0018D749B6|nr:sulfatase [Sphingomonas sp. CFBP 13733]